MQVWCDWNSRRWHLLPSLPASMSLSLYTARWWRIGQARQECCQASWERLPRGASSSKCGDAQSHLPMSRVACAFAEWSSIHLPPLIVHLLRIGCSSWLLLLATEYPCLPTGGVVDPKLPLCMTSGYPFHSAFWWTLVRMPFASWEYFDLMCLALICPWFSYPAATPS